MKNQARSLSDKEGIWRAMDIPPMVTLLFFAVVSFLFPHTGTLKILGFSLPRGCVVGMGSLCAIPMIWVLVWTERRYKKRSINFIRTFYPQLFIPFFFMESILLSSQVFGGRSHDALFAALDLRIFGFQPCLLFHKAFESSPRFNELMFGSYFSYYVLIATLLWIPWFKKRRKETERAVFIYFTITLLVSVWYVFFRVQGPKYWFPELRDTWYGNFKGYFFVGFFQRMFNAVTLSGAAFPSSHIIFSSLCVILGYRWDRRLLAIYLPLLCLICMATIYLYAHYAVDILAGLVLSPLLYLAASRLYGPAQTALEALGHRDSRSKGVKALRKTTGGFSEDLEA